jgi:hypothetical protein
MCGGFVGNALSAANPKKVLKNPLQAAKDQYKSVDALNVGHRVNMGLGIGDKFSGAIYANADAAKKEAMDKANAISAARAKELAAANANVIDQKRRRKASSVLAKSGAGLTDTTNTVLSAAASYGKPTLGA